MLKSLLLSGWFCPQPCLKFFISLLLMAPMIVSPLQGALAAPVETAIAPNTVQTEIASPVSPESPTTDQPEAQIDPLNSPYPIPWNWVTTTQAEASANGGSGIRYYRSKSIVSPDGQYAAYSRIQLEAQPELYHTRVSSVMFLENLQTGNLQLITANSPLADDPLVAAQAADIPGAISIVTPVSWSPTSDRLLARQFEGLFSSSDAYDYAVIWDRQQNQTTTVAPSQAQCNHEISILLGWSKTAPDQILFRAGNLGDEEFPLWAVASDGSTIAAKDVEQPIVFGQEINQSWSGPQLAWR